MAKAPARSTLPGNLYQKNGRWWWKVDLPSEDKPKARALKPAGSRCATTDYHESEEVAREMWRLAVEAQAEARIKAQTLAQAENANAKVRAEAADAIEKAQAESKAREEAILREQTERRADSEAQARAEAKLNKALEGIQRTGTCECCGRKDIPEIDSGQLLCPDCLKMLRG